MSAAYYLQHGAITSDFLRLQSIRHDHDGSWRQNREWHTESFLRAIFK